MCIVHVYESTCVCNISWHVLWLINTCTCKLAHDDKNSDTSCLRNIFNEHNIFVSDAREQYVFV